MAGTKEAPSRGAMSSSIHTSASAGAGAATSSKKKRKAPPASLFDGRAEESGLPLSKKSKRVDGEEGEGGPRSPVASASDSDSDSASVTVGKAKAKAKAKVKGGQATLTPHAAKFLKLQEARRRKREEGSKRRDGDASKTEGRGVHGADASSRSSQADTSITSTRTGTNKTKSKSKALRKQVAPSALPWTPVALPTEALSSGGGSSTDADFFAGLFEGGLDDYMGLQEVKGVRVRYAAPSQGRKGGEEDDEDGDEEVEEVEAVMDDADGDEKGDGKDESVKKRGKVIQFLVREDMVGPPPDKGDGKNASSKTGSQPAKASTAKKVKAQADETVSSARSGPVKDGEEDDADMVSLGDADEEEDIKDVDDSTALGQVNWAALDSFDETKLPGWSKIALDARLKAGLWKLNFSRPTGIQAAALPHALGLEQVTSREGDDEERRAHRDVVGVAQTGSGKTLAYGLPILHHYLTHGAQADSKGDADADADADEDKQTIRPLTALILTPTRELAIQVADHLRALVDATSQAEAAILVGASSSAQGGDGGAMGRHWVSIVTVCGGMSVQKQRRLLTRGKGADIVVATPGRLWELLSEDDDFAARMKQIRFLVIDEADRMVEVGHFAEMDSILKIVRRPGEVEDVGDHLVKEAAPKIPLNPIAQSFLAKVEGGREDLQTFVFSATLSKTLQCNLTRAKRRTLSRKKRAETTTLDDLMMRVDFRDPDPVVVDLSPETGVAEGVHEMKVECLTKDKDLYLYYFLLRYPGRTLVFLNSIDGIRRLVPILTHLGLHPFPLHSQLQQKQRLKNLDRFRAVDLGAGAKVASGAGSAGGGERGQPPASAVILATDVAARGLDIKGVDHVVHYQLPRSADTYVHRSGRTGRAGTEGVALAIVDPAEKRVWKELCFSLKRKDSIPSMTIEFSFFDPLRARLDLAKEIDKAEHRASKASHDDAWLRKMAQEADIDLEDSDGVADEDAGGGKKTKTKGGKGKGSGGAGGSNVAALKEELQALLRQPLKARGVSFKYITSGSRANFAEEVLNSSRRDIVTDAPKLLNGGGKAKKGRP